MSHEGNRRTTSAFVSGKTRSPVADERQHAADGHLCAEHLANNAGHLRNAVPRFRRSNLHLYRGQKHRCNRLPCTVVLRAWSVGVWRVSQSLACERASSNIRRRLLGKHELGPHKRTCQYLEEHLSTQLFSPTFRSASLYLPVSPTTASSRGTVDSPAKNPNGCRQQVVTRCSASVEQHAARSTTEQSHLLSMHFSWHAATILHAGSTRVSNCVRGHNDETITGNDAVLVNSRRMSQLVRAA